MKMTAQCNLCEFKVTKNGHHKTADAIDDHCRTEHEKEFKEKVVNDSNIMWQITELEKTKIRLWEMERTNPKKVK